MNGHGNQWKYEYEKQDSFEHNRELKPSTLEYRVFIY